KQMIRNSNQYSNKVKNAKNDGKTVKNKQPSRTTIIGTAQIDSKTNNAFAGQEKKIGVFVNRVKNHVTSEDILAYISKKPDIDIASKEVKEIPGDPENLKRFVVAAPFMLKEA
ncbi:hypothetical protein HHI36_014515, partial [Cryptolaemus montrouzieri]